MRACPKTLSVKRGNVTVKVYPITNRAKGNEYRQFVLAYRDTTGKRVLRKFANPDEARREAELAATKLATGEADVLSLTNGERSQYVKAVPILSEIGVPLLSAVEDYAAARKSLPSGVTLVAAVEFYRQKHQLGFSSMCVGDAVEKYLAGKQRMDWSDSHLRSVKGSLNRFALTLQMPLRDVTAHLVQNFLDNLASRRDEKQALSRTSRRNFYRIIATFLRYAVRQRWVSKDMLEELEALDVPASSLAPVEIFTPDEMTRLLTTAAGQWPEIVPYLAVGAFAGLRAAEIKRLDWRQVSFEQGHVEVLARNAKVRGRRRLVPMSENLREWLKQPAKTEGQVAPANGNVPRWLWRVAKRSGVAWKQNALRHSYISYRCAVTKNVAQTSYEAGNSPAIIHTHYLNAQTEQAGRAWFGIHPAEANSAPTT